MSQVTLKGWAVIEDGCTIDFTIQDDEVEL
jgi:hypothetical protein